MCGLLFRPRFFVFSAVIFLLFSIKSFSVPNPVILDLQDAGVMKYNGEYYISGNLIAGDIMVSPDLIHWSDRIHVFSMENDWAIGASASDPNIHACDLKYVNGTFHFYWSVNRHDVGVVQIGHAVSDTPLGKYTEPVKNTWFDGKIDACLFKDDDGTPYLYSVKFYEEFKDRFPPYIYENASNYIWGQKMKDPWTLTDKPRFLLFASPRTWETTDHNVIEGPWVVKYRDKYYMMYNGNHTAAVFGSYAFGCAVSDTPLGFSEEKKVSNPVMDKLLLSGGQDIFNCGQPSLIRGPNGFEWWLVYMAHYGTQRPYRSQGTDRVYFFDRDMYVDGPTALESPGYHPTPSSPTVLDLFNEDSDKMPSYWKPVKGSWSVSDGEARQSDLSRTCRALLRSVPAENYLFEANVKINSGEQAGVTAYFEDKNNYVEILLNSSTKKCYASVKEDGALTTQKFDLPNDFASNAYHKITVYKNGTQFFFLIDDECRPDLAKHHLSTSFARAKGMPGLLTVETDASFDGVIYTVGWDEWDTGITGWGDSKSGTTSSGSWIVDTDENDGYDGIKQTVTSGESMVFKGDLMPEYEFITQVTRIEQASESGEKTMGVYPVYIDDNNYLRADINPDAGIFRLQGKKDGRNLEEKEGILPKRIVTDTSDKKTGETWRYTTADPGTGWEKTDYNDSNWAVGEGVFGNTGKTNRIIRTEWKSSDIWLRRTISPDSRLPELTEFSKLKVLHDDNAEIYINGILALKTTKKRDFYRFYDISPEARASFRENGNVIAVHCSGEDGIQYIDVGICNPKIHDMPESYNIRVIKRDMCTFLMINGQEIASLSETWPPSQVGLVSKNMSCKYNGISLVRLGAQYGTKTGKSTANNDNFDDNLLSLRWKQRPVHKSDPKKQDDYTVTDIAFCEFNNCLEIEGAERGSDGDFYGQSLHYDVPLTGSNTVQFDFNSLAIKEYRMPHVHPPFELYGAIGLRLWYDNNNWIEIRQTKDMQGDQFEITTVSNGITKTTSQPHSAESGSLKVAFDDKTGNVKCYFSGDTMGTANMPVMQGKNYYARITAYTNTQKSMMSANVDNFRIK